MAKTGIYIFNFMILWFLGKIYTPVRRYKLISKCMNMIINLCVWISPLISIQLSVGVQHASYIVCRALCKCAMGYFTSILIGCWKGSVGVSLVWKETRNEWITKTKYLFFNLTKTLYLDEVHGLEVWVYGVDDGL